MSTVTVHKIREANDASPPFLEPIDRLFDEIRQRAFSLFEERGRVSGHDLDDWLQAEREVLWSPPAELIEREKEFQARVAVPGFEAKDIRITALPDAIVIEADAETKQEKSGEDVLLSEFGARKFLWRFNLPSPIDLGKTTATLEKGILKLVAVKSTEPNEKKVGAASA